NCNAGGNIITVDILDGSMQMRAGLLMYGNLISPGLCKGLNKIIRMLNHKVYIYKSICTLGSSFNYIGAVADIRHKMTIHNVAMDPLSIRFIAFLNLGPELAVVGR